VLVTRGAIVEEKGDRLWQIDDVARYLGMPTSAIYKMTARKARVRIPHVRIGGRLRFQKAKIDRWVELMSVSNLDMLARVKSAAKEAR
jgi:excisionase family DNA binding protein